MFKNQRSHKTGVANASGVATVSIGDTGADKWQVYCVGITGTSTVTVKVMLQEDDTYRNFSGNTIDLSDPVALIVEGNVNSFQGTAATDTDDYTLVAGPLYV